MNDESREVPWNSTWSLAHSLSRSLPRQADASRGRAARSTTVLGQPFGRTLLLVVVVGLLGYAASRILQGLFDPDRLGNNWRGLAIRASFLARGALHAVLDWQAFRLCRGLSAASGTTEREVATEAFRWPLGDWLVVLAGLGLIGFAVQQVYAAITCRLEPISMSKKCDARLASGRWV